MSIGTKLICILWYAYLFAKESFYLDICLLEILDDKCKFQLRLYKYLGLNKYHHQDIACL